MSLLSRLLFPPKCASCSTLLELDAPLDEALCPDCQKLWESDKLETCGVCAKRVGDCACLTERMQKAKCRGFYKLVYYFPGKRVRVPNRLIYAVKQSRDQRTVDFLARELFGAVERLMKEESISSSDVILTYIPRGATAKLQYGTDQSRELAEALSKNSGLPMCPLIRRRWGRGKQQKKLDPVARYKNAKESFLPVANPVISPKGKTVILLDDIVTTGASMAVGVRILRKMGASGVYALALASDYLNRDRAVY